MFDCFYKDIFLGEDEDNIGSLRGEWPGNDRLKLFKKLKLPYHNVFIMLYAYKHNYISYDYYNNEYNETRKRRRRIDDSNKHRVFADIYIKDEACKNFLALDIHEKEFVSYVTKIKPRNW